MNRLKEGLEPVDAQPDAGDYFVIEASCGVWQVSTEMARFIESILDAEVRPWWISFVDVSGSRVRVRAGLIQAICQCSAAQRASDRQQSRALNRERKADRDWTEDE